MKIKLQIDAHMYQQSIRKTNAKESFIVDLVQYYFYTPMTYGMNFYILTHQSPISPITAQRHVNLITHIIIGLHQKYF